MISQELINELLDNAKQNGYDMLAESDEAIAIDLGTCAQEVEGLEPEVLVPFIKVWKDGQIV